MTAARKLDTYTEDCYTTDYIESLPDGERAELIDGNVIYMMAPPMRIHQKISHKLSYSIEAYIQKNNGNCEVYPAPFAVYLNKDNKTYVEPDISVICDKSKLTEKGCNGAPDWVIEVVSPSSEKMDTFTKLHKYKTSGVREYWIVHPEEKKILVYFFEKGIIEVYDFGDKIPVNIYNGDLVIDTTNIV